MLVIPGGELLYLPFEALLTDSTALPDSFRDLPFLVKNFSVSYGLSAALLLQAKKENAGSPNRFDLDFVAFAPSYEGLTNEAPVRDWFTEPRSKDKKRAGFGDLEFNRTEVEYIAKTWFPQTGKTYLGLAATKRQFERLVQLPRILHLALHAKSNDRAGHQSFLVFAYDKNDSLPGRLDIRVEAKDILGKHQKFPVEMLVLSGCETGLGSLRRGEGIVGFNRAFSFAGAKSIVSSLWAVDDEQTQSLLVRFYKQLKINRLPKDKAMQAAKRELLEEGRAPYFWASFTVFGEVGAVF